MITDEEKAAIMEGARQRDMFIALAAEQFIQTKGLTRQFTSYLKELNETGKSPSPYYPFLRKCFYDGCLQGKMWDSACPTHQRENGFEDENRYTCIDLEDGDECGKDCKQAVIEYPQLYKPGPHILTGYCIFCKQHKDVHVKDGDIDFYFCPSESTASTVET